MYGVQLEESGLALIPKKFGSYRDLMLEYRTVSRIATPLDLQFRTIGFQDSIDGSRTDPRQLTGHLLPDIQLRLYPQHRQVGA